MWTWKLDQKMKIWMLFYARWAAPEAEISSELEKIQIIWTRAHPRLCLQTKPGGFLSFCERCPTFQHVLSTRPPARVLQVRLCCLQRYRRFIFINDLVRSITGTCCATYIIIIIVIIMYFWGRWGWRSHWNVGSVHKGVSAAAIGAQQHCKANRL